MSHLLWRAATDSLPPDVVGYGTPAVS